MNHGKIGVESFERARLPSRAVSPLAKMYGTARSRAPSRLSLAWCFSVTTEAVPCQTVGEYGVASVMSKRC